MLYYFMRRGRYRIYSQAKFSTKVHISLCVCICVCMRVCALHKYVDKKVCL